MRAAKNAPRCTCVTDSVTDCTAQGSEVIHRGVTDQKSLTLPDRQQTGKPVTSVTQASYPQAGVTDQPKSKVDVDHARACNTHAQSASTGKTTQSVTPVTGHTLGGTP